MRTPRERELAGSKAMLTQWTGVLAGPLAWLMQLSTNYALVEHVCSTGNEFLLHGISGVAVLATAAGAWLAWGVWKRTGSSWPGEEGGTIGRSRFMAASGLVFSAFFAVLILGQTIPTLMLGPCK